jgi:hypothetical protein
MRFFFLQTKRQKKRYIYQQILPYCQTRTTV